MDQRTQELYRAWRSDPGDRDVFDHFWHAMQRSTGKDELTLRIELSGLFTPSEKGGWVHTQTGTRFVRVEKQIGASITGRFEVTREFLLEVDGTRITIWARDSQLLAGAQANGLMLPTARVLATQEAVRHLGRSYYLVEDVHTPDVLTSDEPSVFWAAGTASDDLWMHGTHADLVFAGRGIQFDPGEVFNKRMRRSHMGLNMPIVSGRMDGNVREVRERAGPFREQPPEHEGPSPFAGTESDQATPPTKSDQASSPGGPDFPQQQDAFDLLLGDSLNMDWQDDPLSVLEDDGREHEALADALRLVQLPMTLIQPGGSVRFARIRGTSIEGGRGDDGRVWRLEQQRVRCWL